MRDLQCKNLQNDSHPMQGRKKHDKHYNLVERFTLDIRRSFLTKRGTRPSEISRKAVETLLICCCYKHIRKAAILVQRDG